MTCTYKGEGESSQL